MKVKILIMLFGLAVIYSSCGNKKPVDTAQAKDTMTKTSVTDYKMMIVAKLSVKPEMIKDFVAAAGEMIEKSNKESGCSFYQLYQDPYDNTRFVFVEEYVNQAAVDAHFATDYFKAFGPKISNLVTAPAEIKIISVAKEVTQ
jgi:quinol monooxygenase YgiN